MSYIFWEIKKQVWKRTGCPSTERTKDLKSRLHTIRTVTRILIILSIVHATRVSPTRRNQSRNYRAYSNAKSSFRSCTRSICRTTWIYTVPSLLSSQNFYSVSSSLHESRIPCLSQSPFQTHFASSYRRLAWRLLILEYMSSYARHM